MKTEKAIERIKAFRDYLCAGNPIWDVDECKEAFDIAIAAMEQRWMPAVDVPDRKVGKWIPCKERLPEDLEEVNVTWVNHEPEPYYNFVKDKPLTATAVYYKEKWYWYSSTCADFLAEYGRNPNEEIDDGIEIIAWMPLPEPWRGEEDE